MPRTYVKTGRPPGRPKRNTTPGNISPTNTPPRRKKPLPSDLTPRQEIVAAALASGATKRDALMTAGYSPQTKSLDALIADGGKIRLRVQEMLARKGLTLDKAGDKIAEMYDGKREIQNPALFSKGAALAAMAAGETLPTTIEVRDNESQRWAVEQTLKLHDAYPKPTDVQAPAGPLRVAITEDTVSTPDGRTGRRMVVEIGEQ